MTCTNPVSWNFEKTETRLNIMDSSSFRNLKNIKMELTFPYNSIVRQLKNEMERYLSIFQGI